MPSLVGSEMCIRDRSITKTVFEPALNSTAPQLLPPRLRSEPVPAFSTSQQLPQRGFPGFVHHHHPAKFNAPAPPAYGYAPASSAYNTAPPAPPAYRHAPPPPPPPAAYGSAPPRPTPTTFGPPGAPPPPPPPMHAGVAKHGAAAAFNRGGAFSAAACGRGERGSSEGRGCTQPELEASSGIVPVTFARSA